MASALTHLDETGTAQMVDVSAKPDTRRTAVAEGVVRMRPETVQLILAHGVAKGDVLTVARVAGIMAAKRTSDLIPMCHPLPLTDVRMELAAVEDRVEIRATASTVGKTGVEMEALTAAAVAGLTIYDMCKAADKTMVIDAVRLVSKTGGKSDWPGASGPTAPSSTRDPSDGES